MNDIMHIFMWSEIHISIHFHKFRKNAKNICKYKTYIIISHFTTTPPLVESKKDLYEFQFTDFTDFAVI